MRQILQQIDQLRQQREQEREAKELQKSVKDRMAGLIWRTLCEASLLSLMVHLICRATISESISNGILITSFVNLWTFIKQSKRQRQLKKLQR